MSATSGQHFLFGSLWPNDNYIVRYSDKEFSRVPTDQNAKINNWASATLMLPDQYFISGGLSNNGKIISNEAMVFDVNTNQLIQFPSFQQARYVHGSVYLDGVMYILGGRHYGADFESVLSHCEKFVDGQWRSMAAMSKRRSNFGVFIYENRIHVMGGFDGRKNTRSCEFYDAQKNIWRRAPFRLARGLAGFHIIPLVDQLIIVGGMTQQGPSQACQVLDLRNGNIIAHSQMLELRALSNMIQDGHQYIIYGGAEQNVCESYQNQDQCWIQVDVVIPEDLQQLFLTGLRGFTATTIVPTIQQMAGHIEQTQLEFAPDQVGFLFGNDEFPFILPIPKQSSEQIKAIPVPQNLQLHSYMSSCTVDSELPNCKQVFIGGGIDSKISLINKKCYLVTIIFPELKLKIRKIGKLSYDRYAAACIYKEPFVYVIGGRGYQNDMLSLHNTVERYNINEEYFDQISPLNESKCSLTAAVLNDKIYVFGGYIGEGQISHRIECYNENTSQWDLLNIELPFALEGLSSLVRNDEILIIGGKGLDGSKNDVIQFTQEMLDDNMNVNGQILTKLQHQRSLPKPMLMDDQSILILGGHFFDTPTTTFGEVLFDEESNTQEYVDEIELVIMILGAEKSINMFSLAQ